MVSTTTGWIRGWIRTILGSFLGSISDHQGVDSAWYQPQQGGLEQFLDHFWDQFLIIKVLILHGINHNRVD